MLGSEKCRSKEVILELIFSPIFSDLHRLSKNPWYLGRGPEGCVCAFFLVSAFFV